MASQPFSNDNVDYYVFVGQNYNDFDSDDHDEGDGDSNDNVDKKLSKKLKPLFMVTVCILTFHGAGDR